MPEYSQMTTTKEVININKFKKFLQNEEIKDMVFY